MREAALTFLRWRCLLGDSSARNPPFSYAKHVSPRERLQTTFQNPLIMPRPARFERKGPDGLDARRPIHTSQKYLLDQRCSWKAIMLHTSRIHAYGSPVPSIEELRKLLWALHAKMLAKDLYAQSMTERRNCMAADAHRLRGLGPAHMISKTVSV